MRRHIIRGLSAAAAAGIAFLTLGFTGAGSPATAAAMSLGPPVYTTGRAGYICDGRWFRYVAATVTVAPRLVPKADGGSMIIDLAHQQQGGAVIAMIGVDPGGGAGTVWWQAAGQPGYAAFALSPKIGDQIAVSIYYDRTSRVTFTATDITQGITKTAGSTVNKVVANAAELWSAANNNPAPPRTDTRMWKVAGTHVTTYTGVHGTVTGPWQTTKWIATTNGTASGAVVLSPSGLWNGGQNFGIWLRHH